MNTRYFKVYVTALILLLISACNVERKVTLEDAVIAVIGDSIGNGYNLATPWPTLIGQELGKQVINTSVSGMETGWGLSVIDEIIQTHEPTHLLISLGTNDAVRGPSLEMAVANLEEMVTRAKSQNIVVLLGNVIPNLQSPEADQRALTINLGIANIDGVVFVDSRANMKGGVGLLVDGIHPNQSGQQIIADTFLEALLPTFAEQ